MGSLAADEMAAAAGEGLLSKSSALMWHLQSNHFPPVHQVFVPAASAAIDHVAADDPDVEIELPNGRVLTALDIVEQLHLWPFVDLD